MEYLQSLCGEHKSIHKWPTMMRDGWERPMTHQIYTADVMLCPSLILDDDGTMIPSQVDVDSPESI